MNAKLQGWVTAVATSVLEQGERIEMSSVANVGTVSLKRRAATAAIAGVLSGGTLMVAVQPKKFFLALTDRRLILFSQGMSGKPEKKPAIVLPRRLLHTGETTKGLLTATFELSIEGEQKGLKFVFPLPARADAPLISAALNATGHAGR
jgi:hypothetical protein